jgi:hypothetical protein
MSRLFTFGCSFTNYKWPTWADILGLEYDHYENWGRAGSGNHFIFYSLIECINLNKITKADTVAIMWSTVDREDRFVNGKWIGAGSIYNETSAGLYGDTFVANVADDNGYRLVSTLLVDATIKILDSIGCTYHLLAMEPIMSESRFLSELTMRQHQVAASPAIKEMIASRFKDSLGVIEPAVMDLLFNGTVETLLTNNPVALSDSEFNIKFNDIKNSYNKVRGIDWPDFNAFAADLSMVISNAQVDDEIRTVFDYDLKLRTLADQQKGLIRNDSHPRPLEHLAYLQQLDFNLTPAQINTANQWNSELLAGIKSRLPHRKPVNRIGNQ